MLFSMELHFLNGEIMETCNKSYNLVILNGLFTKEVGFICLKKKFTEMQSRDIKTKRRKFGTT